MSLLYSSSEGQWHHIRFFTLILCHDHQEVTQFCQKKYMYLNSVEIMVAQMDTYRVLQTIQMKLILLWVLAERAVLARAKTALEFKYTI